MKTVCGLDVHKDSVYVCIMQANGEKFESKFGTLTPDLYRLHETLSHYHVEQVAMESTATARKIAVIIYHLLKEKQSYCYEFSQTDMQRMLLTKVRNINKTIQKYNISMNDLAFEPI